MMDYLLIAKTAIKIGFVLFTFGIVVYFIWTQLISKIFFKKDKRRDKYGKQFNREEIRSIEESKGTEDDQQAKGTRTIRRERGRITRSNTYTRKLEADIEYLTESTNRLTEELRQERARRIGETTQDRTRDSEHERHGSVSPRRTTSKLPTKRFIESEE